MAHKNNKSIRPWLISACLAALLLWQPSLHAQIKSITPTTLAYGKPGEVVVKLAPQVPPVQLSLSPGGPYSKHLLQLPEVAKDLLLGERVAYVSVGSAGLLVVDLSSKTIVNQISTSADFGAMALARQRLYVLSGAAALAVFAVDDPESPQLLSRFSTSAAIVALTVDERALYLLTDEGSLIILQWQNGTLVQRSRMDVGRSAVGLAAADEYLLIASGARGVLAIATGDLGQPHQVSRYRTTGAARDVVVADSLAYVAQGEEGILVLDASRPEEMEWVSSYANLGDVEGVVAQGERVALFNRRAEIMMLDMAMPAMPTLFAAYRHGGTVTAVSLLAADAWVVSDAQLEQVDFAAEPPQFSNQSLDIGRGVNGGGQRRGAIVNDIAYVADWFSGIHLYDISDPRQPLLLSSFHTPGSPKGIAVRDGFAFVADDDHGLQVVDVSDPRHPRGLAQLATPGLAYIPKLVGDVLYLASHRGGFQIIDISEPSSPQIVADIMTPGLAWGIDVAGDIAYVAADQAGLLLFDVSDIKRPTYLGSFDPEGRAEDVMVRDGLAYVTFFDQGLHIIDVSEPQRPRPLSQMPTPGNARGIDLKGRYAAVADWLAGVHIIDVGDPSRPMRVGRYDTAGAAWGVRFNGDNLAVMDWWGGLTLLDVSQPHQPRLQSRYQARGQVKATAAKDQYLYTAHGDAGVRVFDIKNPLNPTWVTALELGADVIDIALVGNLAYVATAAELIAIDISDPFNVKEVGRLKLEVTISALRVTATTVLLLAPTFGLITVDVRDTSRMSVVQRYAVVEGVLDYDVGADLLYLLTAQGELLEFGVSPLGKPNLLRRHPMFASANSVRVQQGLVYINTGGRIVIYERNPQGLAELAEFVPPAEVAHMAVDDNVLYLNLGSALLRVDITHPAKPQVQASYPLSATVTSLTTHQGVVYGAGNAMVTAIQPLPKVEIHASDDNTVRLEIPKGMSVGAYHIDIKGPTDSHSRWPNAFRVELPF